MRTIAFAFVTMLIAAPTAAQTLYPPPPCWVYGRLAYGYATERNQGFSAQSRLEGIEDGPGRDQVMIGHARNMIRDLWAHPQVSPDAAYQWASQWCGWRPLPR